MASEIEGPLKDNVVEYRLFMSIPDEIRACEEVTRHLCGRRDLILAYVGRFCINYIWQVEPFTLRVIAGTGQYIDSRKIVRINFVVSLYLVY